MNLTKEGKIFFLGPTFLFHQFLYLVLQPRAPARCSFVRLPQIFQFFLQALDGVVGLLEPIVETVPCADRVVEFVLLGVKDFGFLGADAL